MSAEEFVLWQAYLRRHPSGFHWENWMQAHLVREVNRLLPRKRGDKMPKLDAFLWNPPPPLIAERLRREARTKRRKEDRSE